MNQGQLNAIKERVAKAKSGPWDINRNSDDDVFVTDIWFDGEDGGHVEIHGDTVASSIYNAEFIAHAREDVPALVAEVERLRKALSYYADEKHYEPYCIPIQMGDYASDVTEDTGEIARQTLVGESNEN